jgi:hypothetical protein
MLREIVLVLVYVEVLFPYLAPSYHYTKKTNFLRVSMETLGS